MKMEALTASSSSSSSCSSTSSFSPSPVLASPNRRWGRGRRMCAVRFPRSPIRTSPVLVSRSRRWACAAGGGDVERRRDGEGEEDGIPRSPEELVRRVSSRSYDLKRQLKQTMDSIAYDVLDTNPWREQPKPVYVLTQRENQLCTMKTRRNRSEVERELGLLFSKQKEDIGKRSKQASSGTKFRMLVEDIREGILVFEDEHDAVRYCDLLQGGRGCEGIAEIEASSVFDICRKMRALAVLFRRGRTPPLPEILELNLKARNRSLED